jgi:DNA-binding transcriptional LysR family regulator
MFDIRSSYLMAPLEQYRIFAAVAKWGSFSKAAGELHITQPAVSQAIKLLERQIDAQLFVRTSRGVTLTEAGKILQSYVEQALSAFESAENHINQLKTLEHGKLYIGASDTLSQHFLLPYLKKFHEKYPHVNLKVTNRTSQDTVDLLNQGKVDIGFIHIPTEVKEHISVLPLLELHDTFVYNEKHFPFIKGEFLLNDLQHFPLLMLEKESSTRQYLDSFFKSKNITLSPEIELGSHDLLLSFAEIGLGIAAVVREYSQKELKNGTLKEIKLKSEIPSRTIALIFRNKIPLTFSAREFISLLGINISPNNVFIAKDKQTKL